MFSFLGNVSSFFDMFLTFGTTFNNAFSTLFSGMSGLFGGK